jgi:MFS family permease
MYDRKHLFISANTHPFPPSLLVVAAWTTFGTLQIQSDWAWRIPSLIQAFPSLIQLASVWFYEESPRWLISKGREEEALAILAKLHANGDENDELVQLEYREIRQTLAQEKEVAKRSYMELIATPGNRMRLFITITIGFFSQWSGNGLVSYYLTKVLNSVGVTDAFTQNLINGILQIWNLICAVTAAVIVDKVGRRPLWLVSTTGMLVFFVLQTICTGVYTEQGVKSAGTASIAMIFLYYTFYDAAWTPLTVSYVVEIMPFTIRAKGMAVQGLCVNLALFFNSYVNPVALAAIGWKYYIVYCVWLVFELFIVWKFYVETKGRTLEELAEVFDGDQAALVIAEAKRLQAIGAEKIDNEDAAYGTEKV